MFNIPLPKKHAAWLFAIFLVAILFSIYYGFLFPRFEEAYADSFWHEPKPSCFPKEVDGPDEKLCVLFNIPRWISSSSAREISVTFANKTDKELVIDFALAPFYAAKVNENDITKFLIYRKWDEISPEYTASHTIKDVIVPPLSAVKTHFWIRTLSADKVEENDRFTLQGTISVDGKSETIPVQDYPITYSPLKAFLASLFRLILLPPWSNTFLPFIAIFCASFLEERGFFDAKH